MAVLLKKKPSGKMKKLLIILGLVALLSPGCILVSESGTYTYVDAWGCEVDVIENYYTGEVCEETWCYDENYEEWYLYDEYCYY
jgi:hypothetical protein